MAAKKKGARRPPEQRLLIRDDGVVFNYTDALAARPDMKLHQGKAPKDQEAALEAIGSEPEPFDVGTADKAALIAFARDEYGVELGQSIPLGTMREQVMKLAQKKSKGKGDEE